jgi:flagellar secretion chaperone FliS
MFAAASTPFGRNAASAGAYHRIGIETDVEGAGPHQLVSLLFEGCIDAIAQARGALQKGDQKAKGQAIGRAVRIVDEGLKAGLDLDAGGALAADLGALYGYVALRLTQANLHNDDAALAECLRLMQPLREAWSRITPAASGTR